MGSTSKLALVGCTLAATLLVAGCGSGDDGSGPATGSLRVRVMTVGTEPDSDGYLAIIDDTLSQSLAVGGSVEFPGLSTGAHQVRLGGMASHCFPSKYRAQGTVTGGGSSELVLTVNCPAPLRAGLVYWTSVWHGPAGLFRADGLPPAVPILDYPVGTNGYPRLSPGSSRMVFQSVSGDVIVSDLNGLPIANITTATGERGGDIHWSPDGSRLAFGRSTARGFVVVYADGSNPIIVISQGQPVGWSPDGRYLLLTRFGQEHGNNIGALERYDLATRTNLRIYERLSVMVGPAAFTPDGQSVLVAEGNQLFRISAAGGSVTPFMSLAGQPFQMRWSPDGAELAIEAESAYVSQIYVTNSAGSSRRSLTPGDSNYLFGRPSVPHYTQ